MHRVKDEVRDIRKKC